MKDNQNIDHLVKNLKRLQRLCEKELVRIEPVIRSAMASGIQDMNYLDKIADPLYDLVLSGFGQELYDEYLAYVESFNPQKAKKYRDYDDEMNGVYDALIEEAAALAKMYHKGQVDKQGVDYFSGHLTTVGNAGYNWKEKIVGFLHDAAEDTPHRVNEIVQALKEKSNGVSFIFCNFLLSYVKLYIRKENRSEGNNLKKICIFPL